jgi:hypothetical protein
VAQCLITIALHLRRAVAEKKHITIFLKRGFKNWRLLQLKNWASIVIICPVISTIVPNMVELCEGVHEQKRLHACQTRSFSRSGIHFKVAVGVSWL